MALDCSNAFDRLKFTEVLCLLINYVTYVQCTNSELTGTILSLSLRSSKSKKWC